MPTRGVTHPLAVGLIVLCACGEPFAVSGTPETSETSETTTGLGSTTTTGDIPTPATSGVPSDTTSSGDESSSSEETGEPEEGCGDGERKLPEECDDGNVDDGDGCSADCIREPGFICDSGLMTACVPICGDGLVVQGEGCDDGARQPQDGCGANCKVERGWSCSGEPSVCETGCGDGTVAGPEQCDDGNLVSDDGCGAACVVETGWACTSSPSDCSAICGDAALIDDEECDDANAENDDGCSETCSVEFGFHCSGVPSECSSVCGDGLVATDEGCDDGNLNDSDGCASSCTEEFGMDCTGSPSECIHEALVSVDLHHEGGCVVTEAGDVGCFGVRFPDAPQPDDPSEGFLPRFVASGATQVTGGSEHQCILSEDGSVQCWGWNGRAQVSPLVPQYGTVDSPIDVPGLPPIAELASGSTFNCGIDFDGVAWCWGDNARRQLAQVGTPVVDPAPVDLPGPVIDLGLGVEHTCAVLADGTPMCWGHNASDKLGNGGGYAYFPPGPVPGLSDIIDIEAGRYSTCALDTEGQLWCWGAWGGASPVLASLPGPVDAFSFGIDSPAFGCALLSDDRVFCWGRSDELLLNAPFGAPVEMPGMPDGDIVDIEADTAGLCVLLDTQERWCQGDSRRGQLGIAPYTQQYLADPIEFGLEPTAVRLTQYQTYGVLCGVLADGRIACSGQGNLGSSASSIGLFTESLENRAFPVRNLGFEDVTSIAFAWNSLCAATTDGVLCIGDGSQGQLGEGGSGRTDEPVAARGLGSVDEIEGGASFFCARASTRVWCWGSNLAYQTGVGSSTLPQRVPTLVEQVDGVSEIALGAQHACVIQGAGIVHCWGYDQNGELGDHDDDPAPSASPTAVRGLPMGATQLSAGQGHTCALVGTTVYCWGDGRRGQLGQGNFESSDIALSVPGLPPIVRVEAGRNFTCAIDVAAEMWCWGDGDWSKFGNGTSGDYPWRVHFEAASGIEDVATGQSSLCAKTGAGWQCLGFRGSGQLGDGSTLHPSRPQPMLFGP